MVPLSGLWYHVDRPAEGGGNVPVNGPGAKDELVSGPRASALGHLVEDDLRAHAARADVVCATVMWWPPRLMVRQAEVHSQGRPDPIAVISAHLEYGLELVCNGLLPGTRLLRHRRPNSRAPFGAHLDALRPTCTGVALGDALGHGVVTHAAEGARDHAELAADADVAVQLDQLEPSGPYGIATGRADADAGRVIALLAHQGNRESLALPGQRVNSETRRCGKLPSFSNEHASSQLRHPVHLFG